MAANSTVHQFKVTLRDIKPPIWRRIQVPSTYNFYELHCAITSAMGWLDSHLHQFILKNSQTGQRIYIGTPDPSIDMNFEVNEHRTKITKYFKQPKDKLLYEYDFGDSWEHDVVLQRIIPAEANVEYPRCVAGKRACPPDDCGSTPGYYELCEILADPTHEEYKEKMEWLGFLGSEKYDPEQFDPKEVDFDDPAERLRFREMFS